MSDDRVVMGAVPESALGGKYTVFAQLPWNAIGGALLDTLVERLADKFMEEHGGAVLAIVDANVLRAAVVEVVAARLCGAKDVTREEVRRIAEKTRDGVCVECGANWRSNLKNASGWSFAPEFRESLRERGLDPGTGHKNGCRLSAREVKP